ncbi:peroxiredoxin family protein [Labilibaculum sp.]|uniref:peroxiredoxin family protein n=1 Tax=Labilibaculum sp. TaxID=2060723 RepID=UPI0035630B3F
MSLLFMNKKILVFLFALLAQNVFGQRQLKLIAEMPDCKKEQFLLLRGDEGGVYVVDQAEVNENGLLSISWNGDYGFYRLSGKLGKIDFLISKADFHFSLIGKPEVGELRFPEEDENNQFQYYLSEFEIRNSKMTEIRETLEKMNEQDSSFKDLHTQFAKVQKEKRNLLKELWRNHFDSWSVRMALAQQELLPNLKQKGLKYDEYYQKHFFDYFAFTDTVLQATPIYYEKIGKYLQSQKIDELLENENYKKISDAIGKLFWLTELEPSSQKYLANYLMIRYPEHEYPQMRQIVVDSYKVLNTCEYVLANRIIQNRIRNSRNNKAGWLVPDVDLKNSLDIRIQSLSDVNSDLTLLVVWSGTCIHSKEMLEQIRDLYPEYHDLGLEVVAVSLDSNLNYWREMVSQNYYPWVNACDTQGLNGSLANQFNIYVTPSMFLIDPSLKTIAVPITFFQLENELSQYFK